jgi:hypothetical protein
MTSTKIDFSVNMILALSTLVPVKIASGGIDKERKIFLTVISLVIT